MCARQVNRGTGADGISDPAGNVSVRLRVHALARVHDGLTLMRTAPSAIEQSKPLAFCSHQNAWLLLEGTHDCGTGMVKLYRAALRETDPDKQPARVEEAKRAMKQALRMAVEYEDSDQRHAISEALSHLENIQRS